MRASALVRCVCACCCLSRTVYWKQLFLVSYPFEWHVDRHNWSYLSVRPTGLLTCFAKTFTLDIKLFYAYYGYRQGGRLRFYSAVSVALTLAEGHKVSGQQNLLASCFAYFLMSEKMTFDVVLSSSCFRSWYHFRVRFSWSRKIILLCWLRKKANKLWGCHEFRLSFKLIMVNL